MFNCIFMALARNDYDMVVIPVYVLFSDINETPVIRSFKHHTSVTIMSPSFKSEIYL